MLPFLNMSPDPANTYFSDGLSEEIINALTRVPGLKVIARTSAFAFKGKNEDLRVIGEKLGVKTLLEGSVRRFGKRLRITAQLVDANSGRSTTLTAIEDLAISPREGSNSLTIETAVLAPRDCSGGLWLRRALAELGPGAA